MSTPERETVSFELPDVAEFVAAYGFEPNSEEFGKLVNDATDLGRSSPPYRSLEYLPTALGRERGTSRFYITRSTGSSGLLPARIVEASNYRVAGGSASILELHFGEPKEVDVDVTTLDLFASERA